MDIIKKEVLSSDKIHTLKGVVYLPEGEAKGYFHVVHGMREYIGRYDKFMKEMAKYGYICFGFDNLGHGYTADGDFGFIAHADGWKYLVDDVKLFNDAVRKEYGEKPAVLMGHSMGSFISRLAAKEYPEIYDRYICMGTGGPNGASGVGLLLCNIIKAFKGERHISNMMENMAFASYTKRFDPNDETSWLSVDEENRAKYKADEFVKPKFTVSAMKDLITLQSNANNAKWFNGMNKNKPIMLISGAEDPVGNYGKGVTIVYDKLKQAQCNVVIKLITGARHEILNDFCYQDALNEILAFIA